MKRVRLLGTLLMAIFALTAAAAAMALAEETKVLPEPTAALPITNKATGGKLALITLGGKESKCEGNAGEGSFTSFNLGTFHLLFTKCTGPLGSTCTGAGDPSGLIALLGTVHFWLALLVISGSLVGALVYLIAPFHYTCEAFGVKQLILILGCLAAHAEPTNVLTNLTKDVFISDGTGMPDIRSVLPAGATSEIPCILLNQVNEEGAFEESAQTGTIQNSKFEQNEKLTSVLLMNP
jgi:hypothetical protein